MLLVSQNFWLVFCELCFLKTVAVKKRDMVKVVGEPLKLANWTWSAHLNHIVTDGRSKKKGNKGSKWIKKEATQITLLKNGF